MSSSIRIIQGDCLEEIPKLVASGIVVDAICTDPPYHLTGMHDHKRSKPIGKRGAIGRLNAGFMGQQWDGGDIAFRPETWATIATALKPGGYLLAFGGTRTHHRIWSAIEDAGLVIQDTIMWLYGGGFPKGRTQLKPAWEGICVAYKPGGKRELQINECRIPTDDDMGDPARFSRTSEHEGWNRPGHTEQHKIDRCAGALERAQTFGRWPANVCHDGSDEVMEAFAEFGERKAAPHGPGVITPGMFGIKAGHPGYLDTGTAARFFYCAKAATEDRWGSKHPTVKPVELIRWLVRLVTPPQGIVLDPFAGSGTMAVAAMAEGRNAILVEREAEYIADIRERVAFYEADGRHSLNSKNRHKSEPAAGALL